MLARLAALLALATPAIPQTTWVVDAANGPGADFTEVQPAIDASAPGDVVLVRAGRYEPWSSTDVQLSKGITLRGEGQIELPGISIQAVPADECARVLDFDYWRGVPRLEILGCLGTVHLQNVNLPRVTDVAACTDVRLERCTGSRVQNFYAGQLNISGGSRVLVADCADESAPLWAAVDDSELLVAASHLRGGDGSPEDFFCSGVYGWPGDDGLVLTHGARAFVIDSTVRGGDRGWACVSTNVSAGIAGWSDGSSSLIACRTNLVRSGSSQSSFLPGDGRFDDVESLVSLSLAGDFSVGGDLQFTVRADPGSATYLLLGNEAAVATLAGGLPLLVDPERKLGFGVTPGTGARTIGGEVPTVGAGTSFHLQAVRWQVGEERTFSNAVTLIVR
ncbi:MAG: hypothetical protein AAFP86_09115 [Planctomycetota bacterium]